MLCWNYAFMSKSSVKIKESLDLKFLIRITNNKVAKELEKMLIYQNIINLWLKNGLKLESVQLCFIICLTRHIKFLQIWSWLKNKNYNYIQ